MCLFGDIILCPGIGDTAGCCGRGEMRVPAIARCIKCMWRIHTRRRQVVRAAPNVLFYMRMRSSKNDRENWSGQNRTSRTACYGPAWTCTSCYITGCSLASIGTSCFFHNGSFTSQAAIVQSSHQHHYQQYNWHHYCHFTNSPPTSFHHDNTTHPHPSVTQ